MAFVFSVFGHCVFFAHVVVNTSDEKDKASFISGDLDDKPHIDIILRTLKLNFVQS